MRDIGDEGRHFDARSSDEADNLTGTSSPNFPSAPTNMRGRCSLGHGHVLWTQRVTSSSPGAIEDTPCRGADALLIVLPLAWCISLEKGFSLDDTSSSLD
ncbi:hypothetical protein TNCV_2584311 [Trichonephila clavipes]|nr:hypothetical protein TNCV_2584311 [Trichonephila clavipes]